MWVIEIDGVKVGPGILCNVVRRGTDSFFVDRGNAIFTVEADLKIPKLRRWILDGLAWEGVRDSGIDRALELDGNLVRKISDLMTRYFSLVWRFVEGHTGHRRREKREGKLKLLWNRKF